MEAATAFWLCMLASETTTLVSGTAEPSTATMVLLRRMHFCPVLLLLLLLLCRPNCVGPCPQVTLDTTILHSFLFSPHHHIFGSCSSRSSRSSSQRSPTDRSDIFFTDVLRIHLYRGSSRRFATQHHRLQSATSSPQELQSQNTSALSRRASSRDYR